MRQTLPLPCREAFKCTWNKIYHLSVAHRPVVVLVLPAPDLSDTTHTSALALPLLGVPLCPLYLHMLFVLRFQLQKERPWPTHSAVFSVLTTSLFCCPPKSLTSSEVLFVFLHVFCAFPLAGFCLLCYPWHLAWSLTYSSRCSINIEAEVNECRSHLAGAKYINLTILEGQKGLFTLSKRKLFPD